MGNSKNKPRSHINRVKFQKRRNIISPQARRKQVQSTQLQATSTLEGCRIINLQSLQTFVADMSKHVKECCGEVTLSGEHGRKGLASILSAQCNKCKMAIEFPTSSVSAVWGQMVTGGGYATLREAMSIIGVPVMTKKSFMETERIIGKKWWDSL